jgi:polar amino acid transport system permease protein
MLRGCTSRPATVLGFTIAVVLGLPPRARRGARRCAVVSWPAAFIEFIRSTPILVQLFFLQALVRATPGCR